MTLARDSTSTGMRLGLKWEGRGRIRSDVAWGLEVRKGGAHGGEGAVRQTGRHVCVL